MKFKTWFSIIAAVGFTTAAAFAQKSVPTPSAPRLPMDVVFKGESKFYAIVAKAERGEVTTIVASEVATQICISCGPP